MHEHGYNWRYDEAENLEFMRDLGTDDPEFGVQGLGYGTREIAGVTVYYSSWYDSEWGKVEGVIQWKINNTWFNIEWYISRAILTSK